MKNAITTIVALVFFSSMTVNTCLAGDHRGGGISPFWVPVAIISTLATATLAQQTTVASEHREHLEPRQTVVYVDQRDHQKERFPAYYHDKRHNAYAFSRRNYDVN
jgi:hypothetical protein